MQPEVVPNERPRSIFTVAMRSDEQALWITLRGELDISTHDELLSAFGTDEVADASVIHLQMSELDFCDVRGLCHILLFAQQVRQSGREVKVTGAGHLVRRLISLVGADDELQIS